NYDQLAEIGVLLEDIGFSIGTAKNRAMRDLLMKEAEALRAMAGTLGPTPSESMLIGMAGRNLHDNSAAASSMVEAGFTLAEATDALARLQDASEDLLTRQRPAE